MLNCKNCKLFILFNFVLFFIYFNNVCYHWQIFQIYIFTLDIFDIICFTDYENTKF